jgi:hypothetical protein
MADPVTWQCARVGPEDGVITHRALTKHPLATWGSLVPQVGHWQRRGACDDANERCPLFPGAVKRLHWSLPDPSGASGTEEEQLAVFRQVRDTIQARLEKWLEAV